MRVVVIQPETSLGKRLSADETMYKLRTFFEADPAKLVQNARNGIIVVNRDRGDKIEFAYAEIQL